MNTLTVRLSLFLFTLLCSAQGCLSGEVRGHYTSVSQNTHSLTHTKSHNASHGKSLAHKKDVYIFPSSAPGLSIHCCIMVNVIPYTLKMTRKHFSIHDWLVIWILCMRTHIHTDTQRMSHAAMKRQSFQNEPSDPFFMSRSPFYFIRLWQISFSIKSI